MKKSMIQKEKIIKKSKYIAILLGIVAIVIFLYYVLFIFSNESVTRINVIAQTLYTILTMGLVFFTYKAIKISADALKVSSESVSEMKKQNDNFLEDQKLSNRPYLQVITKHIFSKDEEKNGERIPLPRWNIVLPQEGEDQHDELHYVDLLIQNVGLGPAINVEIKCPNKIMILNLETYVSLSVKDSIAFRLSTRMVKKQKIELEFTFFDILGDCYYQNVTMSVYHRDEEEGSTFLHKISVPKPKQIDS